MTIDQSFPHVSNRVGTAQKRRFQRAGIHRRLFGLGRWGLEWSNAFIGGLTVETEHFAGWVADIDKVVGGAFCGTGGPVGLWDCESCCD